MSTEDGTSSATTFAAKQIGVWEQYLCRKNYAMQFLREEENTLIYGRNFARRQIKSFVEVE